MTGKFEDSKKPGGAHHLLSKLVGEWEGEAKTWFEPDKLSDTSPISGRIRSVLDGRFVIHEYEGTLMNERMQGVAIIGYNLGEKRFTVAWIDNCHNATAIMVSEGTDGEIKENSFDVLGSYKDFQSGGPDWGWRTEFTIFDEKHIVITHYNITPDGQEAKGVEIKYARKA